MMRKFHLLLIWLLLSTWSAWAQALNPSQLFDQVWNRVESDFYRADLKGLDSEALKTEALAELEGVEDREAAVEIINSYLARLKTSHTHLFSVHDPAYYELLDVFAHGPMGEEIRSLFDGELPHYEGISVFTRGAEVVDSVPGGPADMAGLLPGDVILTADGRPFHPMNSFLGKAGQTVQLQVKREESTLSLSIVPQVIQPREEFLKSIGASAEIIDTGLYKIGYVRMWSYAGPEYHQQLQSVVQEKFSDADALLLDLRGRWGGAQPTYLDYFNAIPSLKMIPREGENFEMKAEGWTKPAGLLIDDTVTSGKEILAYGFSKSQIGPLIGKRTAGAAVAGKLYLLPDGHALYLAVADVTLDGQHVEGVGVGPTESATPAVTKRAGALVLDQLLFKNDIRFRIDRDQGVRLSQNFDLQRMSEVDKENDPWLKRVVELRGWPKSSEVGKERAHDFWLLVQHSESGFQETCLELMSAAVDKGEADRKDLAYLEDRVRMGQGRPQRYGTQLFQREGEPLLLWTLEDPDRVEEFRREVGLGPLTDYVKLWGLDGREPRKIMIPAARR